MAAPRPTGGKELLSIGELARRAHVSPRTIRYYEELGILPEPERTSGGTRRYPVDYVFYVEGALALKEMGFSLDEIGELGRWALAGGAKATSARTQELLRSKVTQLEHRIRVLNRLHDLVTEAAAGGRPRRKDRRDLLQLLNEASQPS